MMNKEEKVKTNILGNATLILFSYAETKSYICLFIIFFLNHRLGVVKSASSFFKKINQLINLFGCAGS